MNGGEPEPPFRPSSGARLGYLDLIAAGVEKPPPPETYSPTIHRASTAPGLMTVLPLSAPDLILHQKPPEIFLVRREGAAQAYARTERPVIRMTQRHPDWGCVIFAVMYPAISPTVFQAPHPASSLFVAIKRLNKRIVHQYLQAGGEENPYREMARMEELGDNVHVLRQVEFLEDDDFLYIVSEKACDDGTLKDVIQWFDSEDTMDPDRCHSIFCKILRILGYLERHGINHHDLSPDNFLFLTPDNLVVFDLALSVRIPVNPLTGHRSLIAPQGNFGTYAWMDPTVYSNQTYDGVAMDLWAAGIILYNLLTNQILYERPDSSDLSYRYFVQAQGLSSTPLNERAVELLHDISYHAQYDEMYSRGMQAMITKATAHLNFSPEVIVLLENLLKENLAERYTLAQAMESDYVQRLDETAN